MKNQANVSTQEHGAARTIPVRPHLLTRDELERYHRDGFIVPQFRLSDQEVARLRELMFKLVADNPALADKMMNSWNGVTMAKHQTRKRRGRNIMNTMPSSMASVRKAVKAWNLCGNCCT